MGLAQGRVVIDHGRAPGAAAGAVGVDGALAAPGPRAAPARPEDQGEDHADPADDQQDDPHGVQVDPIDRRRDGPGQDGAGGDQDETRDDAHSQTSVSYDRRTGAQRASAAKSFGGIYTAARTAAITWSTRPSR